MGKFEDEYVRQFNNVEEDELRYRALQDQSVRLPTLSTRYRSSAYVKAMYVNKPQVVIKLVSKASGVTAINRLGDYISRDITPEDSRILGKEGFELEDNEHLILEDENGECYHSKEQRRAIISEWSVDFKARDAFENQQWKKERLEQMILERDQLRAKCVAGKETAEDPKRRADLEKAIERKQYDNQHGKTYDLAIRLPKDTTHMILSVGGKPKNAKQFKKAHAAVSGFLSKHLKETGHRYLFVAHDDTDNLHYHVIIKNRNELDKSNLRFDKADLFLLRQSFAKELEIAGFERGAELRKDRTMTLEKIAKGIEQLHQGQTWYQHQLSKGTNSGFDAFSYRTKVIKKTNFLIGALKAEEKRTLFFEVERHSNIKAMVKELKRFNKAVNTILPKDLADEKEALKKHLAKESKFISDKVQFIKAYSYNGMQGIIQSKHKQNIESASLFLNAHQQHLEKASKHLKQKEWQPFIKDFNQLWQSNHRLLKQLTLSKGKEKDRGGFEIDF